jgi:hypothetical protein
MEPLSVLLRKKINKFEKKKKTHLNQQQKLFGKEWAGIITPFICN